MTVYYVALHHDMMAYMNKKRAILYSRVSLVEQSPEMQIVTMHEFCTRHDYQIVGEFTDRISGKTSDRPALRKVVHKLKCNEADVLIVYSVDRLSRSVSHLLRLVDELRTAKRGIIILREGLDLSGSTPQSDLMLTLFSALSEFEVRLLSSRVVESLRVAKLSGQKLGRPVKVTDEIKARVLALHADGVPIREIARRTPEISRASIQQLVKSHKKP